MHPPTAEAPKGGETTTATMSRVVSLEHQLDMPIEMQRQDASSLRRELDEVRRLVDVLATSSADAARKEASDGALGERVDRLEKYLGELRQIFYDATGTESEQSEDPEEDNVRFLVPDDLRQILSRIAMLEASFA